MDRVFACLIWELNWRKWLLTGGVIRKIWFHCSLLVCSEGEFLIIMYLLLQAIAKCSPGVILNWFHDSRWLLIERDKRRNRSQNNTQDNGKLFGNVAANVFWNSFDIDNTFLFKTTYIFVFEWYFLRFRMKMKSFLLVLLNYVFTLEVRNYNFIVTVPTSTNFVVVHLMLFLALLNRIFFFFFFL